MICVAGYHPKYDFEEVVVGIEAAVIPAPVPVGSGDLLADMEEDHLHSRPKLPAQFVPRAAESGDGPGFMLMDEILGSGSVDVLAEQLAEIMANEGLGSDIGDLDSRYGKPFVVFEIVSLMKYHQITQNKLSNKAK